MTEIPSTPDTSTPDTDTPDTDTPDGPVQDGGRTPSARLGDRATGDIVIDSALQDLRETPGDDLDAQIEAGRRVHRTLQGRLSDLGGE